jgi:hypothetical protein
MNGVSADGVDERGGDEDELVIPHELLDLVGEPAPTLSRFSVAFALELEHAARAPLEPEPLPPPPHRVPARYDRGRLHAETIAAAGRSLAANGFVLLEAASQDQPPPIDGSLCDSCCEAAVAQCDALLVEVGKRLDVNVYNKRFYTREICHRVDGGLRYDLRVDADGAPPCWHALREASEALARPIIAASGLLGDALGVHVDMQGCVVSYPSACDQHFHPDGPASGLINCFVPLVDVDDRNGSTEFKPGTHTQRLDGPTVERTVGVTSNTRRGSLLLFDFRTHHRGRAHRKSDLPRPVAYCVFGAAGSHDRHNFGMHESLWDL